MIKRMSMAAAAAALTVPLLSGIGAGPASADPTACEPNREFVRILSTSTIWHVTHRDPFHLGPGASRTTTKSASKTSSVEAGVGAYGEVSVSANGVIAGVEAKAGVEINRNGAKTRQRSVSVTDSVAASKRDRYLVAYSGVKEVNGRWRKYRCNSRGTDSRVLGDGTAKSFSRDTFSGIALCPAKRYPNGRLPFKACKQAWG